MEPLNGSKATMLMGSYDSPEMITVFVTGIIAILFAIVIIAAFCFGKLCKPTGKALLDPLIKENADMIPPVFYTDGLADPLNQEDLREGSITNR